MNMAALPRETIIGVVGAGTMGAGIAEVAARAGHPVRLFDSTPNAFGKARAGIAERLARRAAKGDLAEAEAAEIVSRVNAADGLDKLKPCGLVIEAIAEDLAAKQMLFRELEARVAPDALLATNTSSLSVTAIASVLAKPARALGLHFFNPAPLMALVEVVSGLGSHPGVIACGMATMRAWRKKPVQCRSTPGFIANRVARSFTGEALRMVEEGVADPVTIDALLCAAGGFRMGPFALMDLIGTDINLAATEGVWRGFAFDPRYAPSLLQREMVAGGLHGRKSGRGYYDYAPGAAKLEPRPLAPQPRPARVIVRGALGPAEPLIARLTASGFELAYIEGPAALLCDNHVVALSDGRPAAVRFAGDLGRPAVLFDYARDFATVGQLALARAPQAAPDAFNKAAGLFQALGITVFEVGDSPGLLVLRTLAMTANEAIAALESGVGNAADIDLAMCIGTNWPEGPLAWTERFGVDRLNVTMAALAACFGTDRYRAAPLLQRAAAANRPLGELAAVGTRWPS
jgi:3-hydroxybutyryl-CoA dehydrogenase